MSDITRPAKIAKISNGDGILENNTSSLSTHDEARADDGAYENLCGRSDEVISMTTVPNLDSRHRPAVSHAVSAFGASCHLRSSGQF